MAETQNTQDSRPTRDEWVAQQLQLLLPAISEASWGEVWEVIQPAPVAP